MTEKEDGFDRYGKDCVVSWTNWGYEGLESCHGAYQLVVWRAGQTGNMRDLRPVMGPIN